MEKEEYFKQVLNTDFSKVSEEDILYLQTVMKCFNYKDSKGKPISITGKFDDQTKQAFIRFKNDIEVREILLNEGNITERKYPRTSDRDIDNAISDLNQEIKNYGNTFTGEAWKSAKNFYKNAEEAYKINQKHEKAEEIYLELKDPNSRDQLAKKLKEKGFSTGKEEIYDAIAINGTNNEKTKNTTTVSKVEYISSPVLICSLRDMDRILVLDKRELPDKKHLKPEVATNNKPEAAKPALQNTEKEKAECAADINAMNEKVEAAYKKNYNQPLSNQALNELLEAAKGIGCATLSITQNKDGGHNVQWKLKNSNQQPVQKH